MIRTLHNDSTEGIAAYIMECKVRGIGTTLAHKIAQRYGKQTFRLLCREDYPQIARDINGIGMQRARALHDAFMRKFGPQADEHERKAEEKRRRETIFWGDLGVPVWMRMQLEHTFGKDAIDVINRNPYRMTEVKGIGFKRADEVAAHMNIHGDDERRVRAGLLYVLEELIQMEGHCCLPRDVLIRKAAHPMVLNIDKDRVGEVLNKAIADGTLKEHGNVYSPKMYEAEVDVAVRLTQMNHKSRMEEYMAINCIPSQSIYNDKQKEAIVTAMMHHVMILTGGPGTGKTTTLKGILDAFRAKGMRCVLCAPTGRAAKRMNEATKVTAKTIHRMLEYKNGTFGRDESNNLSEDVVICDESSMIDLLLMQAMLKAMSPQHRLILIGDNDQLPSVGAGRVLGDLIDSGCIPTVRLTEIYRQQEGSYIISNAHNIIHGREPVIKHTDDFFFLPATTEEEAQDIVCDLVAKRLPKAYPGDEIQVLCPMRKDGIKTGCNELNQRLQQALNPHGATMPFGGGLIRQGDRVMQTKNNYNLDVFNGDVGIAERMNKKTEVAMVQYGYWGEREVEVEKSVMEVRYPDHYEWVGYDETEAQELDLCYATTIHKSQGSEYDIVVIVLMPSASIMLQRNILYTAVTRAKKRCIIVGDWQCLTKAIAVWRLRPRYTMLADRMKAIN